MKTFYVYECKACDEKSEPILASSNPPMLWYVDHDQDGGTVELCPCCVDDAVKKFLGTRNQDEHLF